jgi:hypothetical protein
MSVTDCPPVLLIAFNRPDCFRELLRALRAAQPRRIYVAIDGPRLPETHPGEIDLVRRNRELVNQIDWPCDLHRRFNESNLGCARAVSTAIDWFFAAEPEGIILEDDCIPAPAFFGYCARMLERYRSEARVLHINGCNMNAPESLAGQQPYSFSHLAIIWGWASWRRAWQYYSLELRETDIPPWPTLRKAGLGRGHAYGFRRKLIELVRGKFSTWDYQWMLHVLHADGLCPTPAGNLIRNIGFGAAATLTKDTEAKMARMEYGASPQRDTEGAFPAIQPNPDLNCYLATQCFGSNSALTWKLFKNWLRRREA